MKQGFGPYRSSPSHPPHQYQPERGAVQTKVTGIVKDHTTYVPVCIDNTVVNSQRSTGARIVTTAAVPDQLDQEDTGTVDEAGDWTVPVQPWSSTVTVSTRMGAIPTEAIEIVNDHTSYSSVCIDNTVVHGQKVLEPALFLRSDARQTGPGRPRSGR